MKHLPYIIFTIGPSFISALFCMNLGVVLSDKINSVYGLIVTNNTPDMDLC